MTRPIGFSTGSLALGDFSRGLEMCRRAGCTAVELSALRQEELHPLVVALEKLDLRGFDHLSFHAPSRYPCTQEKVIVDMLQVVAAREMSIVVHPDAIHDMGLWRAFGSSLCVENMDWRKPHGRTSLELRQTFVELPEARFCLDLGHAHHVDPTMCEATHMLWDYRARLALLHLSHVNTGSKHEAMGTEIIAAFRRVAHLIPPEIPVILETPVEEGKMRTEVSKVERSLFFLPAIRSSGDERTEIIASVFCEGYEGVTGEPARLVSTTESQGGSDAVVRIGSREVVLELTGYRQRDAYHDQEVNDTRAREAILDSWHSSVVPRMSLRISWGEEQRKGGEGRGITVPQTDDDRRGLADAVLRLAQFVYERPGKYDGRRICFRSKRRWRAMGMVALSEREWPDLARFCDSIVLGRWYHEFSPTLRTSVDARNIGLDRAQLERTVRAHLDKLPSYIQAAGDREVWLVVHSDGYPLSTRLPRMHREKAFELIRQVAGEAALTFDRIWWAEGTIAGPRELFEVLRPAFNGRSSRAGSNRESTPTSTRAGRAPSR